MNILVICQYYYPEPFRINDICEELVRRGHSVTVVTGEPNYPEGKIYPGYEKHCKADEIINGVKIHRCPIIPRRSGMLFRFLNYFSYPISSGRFVRKLAGDYDVVFVNQLSPVMMAEAAIQYAKKNRKQVVMYCLDLWPESLAAGGVKKSSAIYRIFHRISGQIYRHMDRILVTSQLFAPYLAQEFCIEPDRISYLPQYAEELFTPEEHRYTEPFNLLFAGNIGAAQSVETVLRAAARLTDRPVRFHIVGGGTELERLRALAEELMLSNVTFYGRRPLEEMPDYYRMADAMLVTRRADPVLSRTLPGKVQSYMAAGKPVIGAIDGETEQVIREADCGFCGPAEDDAALAENIRRFLCSADKRRMGENARAFYLAHFDREQFMDRLERFLIEVQQ